MTRPEVGEFIDIPGRRKNGGLFGYGMVIKITEPMFGPEGTIDVVLQEHPDQPAGEWQRYRLEPGEWVIV